jgi:hypothetical protein
MIGFSLIGSRSKRSFSRLDCMGCRHACGIIVVPLARFADAPRLGFGEIPRRRICCLAAIARILTSSSNSAGTAVARRTPRSAASICRYNNRDYRDGKNRNRFRPIIPTSFGVRKISTSVMFRRMRGTGPIPRSMAESEPRLASASRFGGTSVAQNSSRVPFDSNAPSHSRGKAPDRARIWRIRRQMQPVENSEQKQ